MVPAYFRLMQVAERPIVKSWTEGVPLEPDVWNQVEHLSAQIIVAKG